MKKVLSVFLAVVFLFFLILPAIILIICEKKKMLDTADKQALKPMTREERREALAEYLKRK